MINPEVESVIDLGEAATYVQRSFGGRRPSANTMARWCIAGLGGVKLESLKRGGKRVTTREAIVRFFHRRAEPSIQWAAMGPSDDARRAQRELIAEGI